MNSFYSKFKKNKKIRKSIMTTKTQILDVISQSIDEINVQNELSITKTPETKLFGQESALDSLGLVNLITAIEERIENLTGTYYPIADENAFSQEISPFRSIETLANYIVTAINGK